jgi:hypothetical protein
MHSGARQLGMDSGGTISETTKTLRRVPLVLGHEVRQPQYREFDAGDLGDAKDAPATILGARVPGGSRGH